MIKFFEEMFSKPTVLWNFWEEMAFIALIVVFLLLTFGLIWVIATIQEKIKKRK